MKLTDTVLKYSARVRYTTAEHEIPFKLELPLKLRNKISGKFGRSSTKSCVQEMYNMMACLKKSEFDQSDCGKEISSFRKCNERLSVELTARKKRAHSVLTSGHELTTQQMNALLQKYPQKYDIYD